MSPRPSRPRPTGPTATRRAVLKSSIAVAAVLPMLTRPLRAQGDTLNVYNWDSYMGEDTLQAFTEATGTEVRYDVYASNDELFAKLREGNPGYDVIFPSNNFLQRMIQADMLETLDHGRIPNFANLEPRFQDPAFDPGSAHGICYFWGTTGLGFRESVLEDVQSWSVLFDPEQLAGRKSMLNDVIILRQATKVLGHGLNPTEAAQIDQAVDLLIKAKPGLQSFAPDSGQDLLISGEVDLAMDYNGDILQVMLEDDDLSYVMPAEGGEIWQDLMAIPKGAPNRDAAHAFIDYILVPEVHADIATFVQYACPNAEAKKLLDQYDLNNPALYPPDDVLDRCEPVLYQSEAIEDLLANGLTRVFAA